jgi:hypothetical protein
MKPNYLSGKNKQNLQVKQENDAMHIPSGRLVFPLGFWGVCQCLLGVMWRFLARIILKTHFTKEKSDNIYIFYEKPEKVLFVF